MTKTAKNESISPNIDNDEVTKFQKLADIWWDPKGDMAPLHKYTPPRLKYLRTGIINHFQGKTLRGGAAPYASTEQSLKPLDGLSVLDVGCGGGILSEPLCRMGGTVTGIDVTEKLIQVAKLHAQQGGLTIDYRHTSAENLAHDGEQFDVVICSEVIEHVPDPQHLISTLSKLVKPDGVLFISTINRTYKSYALAIVGAEYVLRWLPRGTHQWSKFLRPSEIATMLNNSTMTMTDATGLCLNIRMRQWQQNPHDLQVNYITTAVHQK